MRATLARVHDDLVLRRRARSRRGVLGGGRRRPRRRAFPEGGGLSVGALLVAFPGAPFYGFAGRAFPAALALDKAAEKALRDLGGASRRARARGGRRARATRSSGPARRRGARAGSSSARAPTRSSWRRPAGPAPRARRGRRGADTGAAADDDGVDALSVKELKRRLDAAGARYADCREKAELRARLGRARRRPRRRRRRRGRGRGARGAGDVPGPAADAVAARRGDGRRPGLGVLPGRGRLRRRRRALRQVGDFAGGLRGARLRARPRARATLGRLICDGEAQLPDGRRLVRADDWDRLAAAFSAEELEAKGLVKARTAAMYGDARGAADAGARVDRAVEDRRRRGAADARDERARPAPRASGSCAPRAPRSPGAATPRPSSAAPCA
ncbi:hypothetical protein SO694_00035313 [Aureococcus anophagefferens]|uniref:SAP domain-containing protein n=1 Tax=Aureococcus anophagefferens TaxID=44056 RepID=A0ABR1FKU7_AURAN